MRAALGGFLVFAIACSPVAAQASTVMGRFNSAQTVPCDVTDGFYNDPTKIYEIGNNSISRNLSATIPPQGFFDQTAGIDGNGCLTTSADAFPSVNDGRTAPHCCVMPLASGACVLHCDVVTE